VSNIILTARRRSSNNGGKRDNNKQLRTELGKSSQFNDKNKLKYEGALDFLVAQKMIRKFLSGNRIETREIRVLKYTKEELATRLGITVEELYKCKRSYFYKKISMRILLPLVALYCSTKWVEDGDMA
jgi:hypothetical protein